MKVRGIDERKQYNMLSASVIVFMASLYVTLLGVFMTQFCTEFPDVPAWYVIVMMTLPVLSYILFEIIACTTIDKIRKKRDAGKVKVIRNSEDEPTMDPFMKFLSILFSKEE